MRINTTSGLIGVISLAVITVLLIGCATQPTPGATPSPRLLPNTATPLRNTATFKPIQAVPPGNPLPDLPLSLGAAWVYSNVVYSGSNLQDVITSTYIYTDVIVDARSAPPYFAVRIDRISSLVEGESLYNPLESGTWWYIISGTQVYKQPGNELETSKVPSLWLEYTFPLTKSRWYPDPEIRKNVSLDSMVSGIRYSFSESEVTVPAGAFKDCFVIDTAYLNGPILVWFCPKFGVVAEKSDHNGTPFGYHAVLMRYSIPPSP